MIDVSFGQIRPNSSFSLWRSRMMNGMMDRMMSGMGLVSILVVVVLLLAAAALLKYLFSR